ncbi:hypothetical protein HMPREF3188_01111 [Tissierellia bacterium KA00581]|nr:hypothetical protein HMPREF3188_01111 [Tissierellia bacterium KA00581]
MRGRRKSSLLDSVIMKKILKNSMYRWYRKGKLMGGVLLFLNTTLIYI